MPPGVSIVVTVFDDREGLSELLPALARQTAAADEIVIADAGSRDGTADLIAYWRDRGLPLRVLDVPGAGISAGRNRGIEAAAHERIAVTDAGCRPEPGWLEALAAGLDEADFVAGTYVVDPATPFEHAVAVSLYPDVAELGDGLGAPARLWLRVFGRAFSADRATGRSMAFTRGAWRRAGGFPEDVDAGEDVAFSAALVRTSPASALAPEALVVWRGRRTWRENARMYRRYAEGEALLGPARRALVRGAGLVGAAALAARGGARGRLAVAGGAAFYCSLPVARARRTGLAARHWWRIPAVIALKDGAMLAGTLAGALQRRTGVVVPGSPARAGAQPPARAATVA
jgi:GT2 family glycosyltransferase